MNEVVYDEAAMFEDTDKFKKSLSKSNIIEIVAGIFAITIFLFYAYLFRNKPILISIGSVLIAVGALYIILYIFKNRMRKGEIPRKEETLAYFKYWIGWYENTHKLGRNIFWWYLLPFTPGLIVFSVGMMQFNPEKSMITLIIVGFSVLIIGGLVYWLNRYYSSKKLQLRIDKLRESISALESK